MREFWVFWSNDAVADVGTVAVQRIWHDNRQFLDRFDFYVGIGTDNQPRTPIVHVFHQLVFHRAAIEHIGLFWLYHCPKRGTLT